MSFRRRLVETLRAIQPVLDVPGVMVVGSEVPNLLEPGAASTLVVSQDVDIAVPIGEHDAVKERLEAVRGLRPSEDEPSVWVPTDPGLIEVNFLGLDRTIDDNSQTYVLEDSSLPLLVFGALSLMRARPPIDIDGVRVPLPAPAGLLLEKLITDRTGEKGDRDLLVVLGLLLVATAGDIDELATRFVSLGPELRYAARNNLSILSLMDGRPEMPDPRGHRGLVHELLSRLESAVERGR